MFVIACVSWLFLLSAHVSIDQWSLYSGNIYVSYLHFSFHRRNSIVPRISKETAANVVVVVITATVRNQRRSHGSSVDRLLKDQLPIRNVVLLIKWSWSYEDGQVQRRWRICLEICYLENKLDDRDLFWQHKKSKFHFQFLTNFNELFLITVGT